MRQVFVWGIFVATLAAVIYGGIWLDRARRKTFSPGTSIFSPVATLRALATRETAYFALLLAGMFLFVSLFIALDQMGYLPR